MVIGPPSFDELQLPELTAKQREVMVLVADNRTSKEIAALLGVSESAVNQRIELIRGRLGGVPRGEMARLYRQKFVREQAFAASLLPTWQKIQVHSAGATPQNPGVEGPSGKSAAQMAAVDPGSGSQPSHWLLPAGLAWLGREEFPAAMVRIVVMGSLALVGMAAAAAITEWISF